MPVTVTLAPPVEATLIGKTPLTVPITKDHAADVDPTPTPAVADTRTDLKIPPDRRPTTYESDSHSVLSQAVCPIRIPEEMLVRPKPAPFTEILDDPVKAILSEPEKIPSDTWSVDIARDTLPTSLPTDNPTRSVRIPPPLDLTKTVVSDTHTVPSHVVPPVDSTAE